MARSNPDPNDVPIAEIILRQPSVSGWQKDTDDAINNELKANDLDPGVLDLELLKLTTYPGESGKKPGRGTIPDKSRFVPAPGDQGEGSLSPLPPKGFLGTPYRGRSYHINIPEEESSDPHRSGQLHPTPAKGEDDDAQDDASMEQILALITQLYGRVERSYNAYLDVVEVEPTWPRLLNLEQTSEIFEWSTRVPDGNGGFIEYPPHLKVIPKEDDVALFKIFDKLGLLETQWIISPFIPDSWLGQIVEKGAQWVIRRIRETTGDVTAWANQDPNFAAFEAYNQSNRKASTDISEGRNIGLLGDWYSDRRFADQAFTGTNPTTLVNIAKASGNLLQEFIDTAEREGYKEWHARLTKGKANTESLFVQDHRFFRKAFGAAPDEELKHQETGSELNWACASVTLFELHDDGRLHPVAIVIDYKVSMEKSVTIFNNKLDPLEPTALGSPIPEEETDWPWRYAKTCAQVSDWIRHEVGVHLTRAHFIEEAIIVATRRTIRMDSIIHTILSPHWYKTLSLNAAARTTLVPQVIKDLVGIKGEYLSNYVLYEYENFDYVKNYVPNDLAERGFPNTAEGLADPKFKNYAYARNMVSMWEVIRRYVLAMLLTSYKQDTADEEIANDANIQNWIQEIRTNGRIQSFPDIKTLDDLTDALTMSIHIAAPFHTAVNYLQNFYQAFAYTEPELVSALPIGRERQWLLAVQVPWLLSFKVADERSLLKFADSQSRNYHGGFSKQAKAIRAIGGQLRDDLKDLGVQFVLTSQAMDKGSIPYMVMDPNLTAVSILI
ncbi:Putative linoleate 9S-lipoxygenase 3-like protein [Cladobotryum mycophilum]|uniref:Manganese lipoxygenase n=1 Tax=Cladobotryum mycophilum TaxID=491253 RepID=A0ABR0SQT9_9HYPO